MPLLNERITELAANTAPASDDYVPHVDRSDTSMAISGTTKKVTFSDLLRTIFSSLALTGDISPAQITSNQNDYNPTGLADASVLRLNTDASRNITSIAGGADGRLLVIHNVGSFNIVLKDEDGATGTAGNRFALSGDVTLTPDQCAILQYDSTSSRWRCIAASRATAGVGAGDIRSDGTVAFAADQSMGSHKLTNVTDPASAQDAATKNYVDAIASGFDFKASVRVATTANITLSAAQTIDGVSVIAGERVLVKNQSTGADNGIYLCAAGAWARATDADSSSEVTAGMLVPVAEGTANADTLWLLTTNDPITLGSTSLTFTQFAVSAPPSGTAGGDLSGTYPNPTVAKVAGVTPGANVATFLGTPSSANLAAALTDETGTGPSVFATSPTLTTPLLGTPSSGNLSNCTADGTNGVGYKNIPQNSQSTAYTTVLGDAGKHLLHPSSDANARTFTIDSNANVAYPIGTAITFINMTSQVVSIAITSDTMRLAGTGTTGTRSLAQYGVATAIKIGTTEWLISGTGLT